MDLLEKQITALRQLGRCDSVTDEDIYDFSIRWGTALAGRLRRLVHYSARGLLDDADADRFHALCGELEQVSGLIDRFNLSRPRLGGDPPRRGLRFR
jgi:hypothetical protein